MVRINRLLPVLLVTAAAYAEDGVDAMCQGADEATLLLRGADFEVTGYDSGRGVLTLRPAATLVRERAPLTLRSGGPLLLAMGAEELEAALDARSRGALVLDLTVRCEVRAQDGPLLQPCCVAATPAVARLRSGQMLLAERDLSRPFPPRPRIDAHVKVGVASSDEALGPAAAEVERRARMHGHSCLLRALHGTRRVSGALSVELRVDQGRHPELPRVVVDGLVNPPLRDCLLRSLFDDAALWEVIPTSGRVFVPFYFSGAAVPPEDAEPIAPSGTNAP